MKKHIFYHFIIIALFTTTIQLSAQKENNSLAIDHQEEYNPQSEKCQGCPHASACFESQKESSPPLRSYIWPLPLLLAGFALSYFGRIKYKHLVWITLGIGSIYLSQHVLQDRFAKAKEASASQTTEIATSESSSNHDEFAPFEESQSNDEFAAFEDNQAEDEFAPLEDNQADGEFAPLNESETDSEFQSFDEQKEALNPSLSDKERHHLGYVIPILLITILAGFLSRYRSTRRLRLVFLLGGLVYMGFYNGGCPCMISSIQDFILWLFGADVFWGTMLWFLGLMVITYFFGRVWCGWFCHLGALQEFIYKSKIIQPLNTLTAQRILKALRYLTFIALLIQLAITRTNIFIHYDPFKVAFNLISANNTGYVLLFILLASSLLINRPFCRGFCPVGLAMGWVMRIPGASLLKPSKTCISCKSCHNACDNGAIIRETKISFIDNGECIRCGDCIDSCHKSAIEESFSNGTITFTCLAEKHNTK